MRAGDRAEDGDQHDQDGARRDRVAEQRERDVVGQPLGHDAGADDGRDQHGRAERFGGKAARQVEHHDAQPAFGNSRPISSSRFCSASLSSVFIGRLMKIEMRLLSMR